MLYCKRLSLEHFRNHGQLVLAFEGRFTAICGPNGVGKTSVLEALKVLALTKGLRPDKDVLQHQAPYYRTAGSFELGGMAFDLHLAFQPGQGKRLLKDGLPVKRMSDHLGTLPLVLVLPDDVQLIREGSTARRSWLDGVLAQSDAGYRQALRQYEKALRQRNALLAQFAERGGYNAEAMEPWTAQLLKHGPPLMEARAALMAAFAPHFEAYYAGIAGEAEVPKLSYLPDVEASSSLEQVLHEALPHDRAAGRTTRGPHRDDLLFELGPLPLKGYGSQGQHKTYVLALMLAQHAYLQAQTGMPPLLLLDDIFDKLDAQRTQALLRLLDEQMEGHFFLTDTSAERVQQRFGAHTQAGIQVIELPLE